MLSDGEGGEVHLQAAVKDWLVPGQNPFGVCAYTRRVDKLAARVSEAIIERMKRAEHKEWGMYEFALNGPDDLLSNRRLFSSPTHQQASWREVVPRMLSY